MAVTRFAPSPTGFLHLGHAHAALFARRHGAVMRLRIEDIDATRCRADYAAAIAEDLAWLGIAWDGEVRVQAAHLPEYAAALDRLRGMDLLYPCFCTRAAIAAEVARAAGAPHGPDGPLYPGTCRRLDEGERSARVAAGAPHAWRLDMAAAARRAGPLTVRVGGIDRPARPERFGDVVLARRDSPTSYHLCCAHDDAAQGITLVTRAEDLAPAAELHRLLGALLGWPAMDHLFHRLLLGPDGRRLSKRDGAVALRALRQAGQTTAEVRALAGFPD
jgi:glutamyl-Q tRNA(Asp) synthetase